MGHNQTTSMAGGLIFIAILSYLIIFFESDLIIGHFFIFVIVIMVPLGRVFPVRPICFTVFQKIFTFDPFIQFAYA